MTRAKKMYVLAIFSALIFAFTWLALTYNPHPEEIDDLVVFDYGDGNICRCDGDDYCHIYKGRLIGCVCSTKEMEQALIDQCIKGGIQCHE